jgi:nucleoside-diphosphate-sugar epimerase
MIKPDLIAGQSVLVTGAAGCIGVWALKILAELGAKPIAYDLHDNRERLALIDDGYENYVWETGDITDYTALDNLIKAHDVKAIIHLAALQAPFCKADPLDSVQVNVVGSTNVFEAARQNGITQISYASSIAAQAMGDNDWLATLYGAHKIYGEQMAAVYWQDWQIPSVGIRPSIVYGPGRDQGMSAAPTIAMLAAFADKPYQIPFTGPVSYLHAEDAAARFVAAITMRHENALVFELDGTPAEIEDVMSIIIERYPNAQISASGAAMPFPADANNGYLNDYLGLAECRTLVDGIDDSFEIFAAAKSRNTLTDEMVVRLIEKN